MSSTLSLFKAVSFFSHNLNDTKPCLTCRTQKVKQDVEKAKYQNNKNNKWAEHYIRCTLSLIYSLYCSPYSVTFFSTSILFSSLYLHTYTPAISRAERQNDISLKSIAVFLYLIRMITALPLVIIESFTQTKWHRLASMGWLTKDIHCEKLGGMRFHLSDDRRCTHHWGLTLLRCELASMKKPSDQILFHYLKTSCLIFEPCITYYNLWHKRIRLHITTSLQ